MHDLKRCQAEAISTTCKTEYVEKLSQSFPDCDKALDSLVRP